MQTTSILFAVFVAFFDQSFGAFRETPASFLGEINARITMTCAFYQEQDRFTNEAIKIRIDWLKAEPQITASTSQQQPEYKPFYEDRRRIFISYARSEVDQIVTNSSTIEIVESRYEDMGKYKCIINGGATYGGSESPVAEIKLTPRIFIDPKIAQLDKHRERISLFCNVSWIGWDRMSGSSNQFNPLIDFSKTGCTETRIEWYATREGTWVNPDDPAAMEKAFDNRRLANQIPNAVVENGGRRLWIYSQTEDSNYKYDEMNRKLKLEEEFFYGNDDQVITRLDRELINIAGIYWCEFQYCYDKDMQFTRQHAVVKYPIKFEQNKMERSLKGFVDEDIELPCVVAGGPYYTLKWGKDNQTLTTLRMMQPRSMNRNDKLRYFDYEYNETTKQPTKLVLRGLQHFDRAEYFCNATSFDGTIISASFMLKVKDKYTAYIPLGVVVVQIFLIFLLIFITEKFFTHDPHRLEKHTERFSVAQSMEMTASRRTLTYDDRRSSAARDFVDLNATSRTNQSLNRGSVI